jgi:hypothetical protein
MPWEQSNPGIAAQTAFAETHTTKQLDDIPAFLKRVRLPDGTIKIGLESSNAQPPNPFKQTTTGRPPVWPPDGNP